MVAAALRTTLFALLLAGILLAAGGSSANDQRGEGLSSFAESVDGAAQQTAAPEIAIIQGLIQQELAPLAPGYLEWMRQRLGAAGLRVARGSSSRLSPGELALPPDGDTTKGRLLYAARAHAAQALLVDLRRNSQGLEIGLRLFDTSTGQLRAGRLSDTTSNTLAEDGSRALKKLLPALGRPMSALEASPSTTIDELAGLGRGLRALDRGELVNALREIERSSVLGAQALRDNVARRAQSAATPLSERARLLAIQGDSGAAWSLISATAPAQLTQSAPDLKLLHAAGEIQSARGRLSEASKYFHHALATNPRDPKTAIGLAEVLTSQKRLDQARGMLERAASLDRNSPDAVVLLASSEEDPVRSATLLMSAGEREARRLNPGRAHLYFNRAAKLNPAIGADAHDRSGQLYEQIGEAQAARDRYASAIQLGGESGPRLHRLARVQQALGDFDGAQSNYIRSLELKANQAEVLSDLGDLYTESGNSEEAVIALEQATSLAPQDATVQCSLARALTLRSQSGDKQRAEQLFTSASKSQPLSGKNLMHMAALQRDSGDLVAARESLESAVVLQPLSPSAQQALAEVIEESGDTAAAAAARERAGIIANASTSTLPTAAEESLQPTRSERFDALLQTFASPGAASESETVVLLGLQLLPPKTWEDRLRSWIRPRELDIPGLERELADAIARHHELVPGALLDSQIPGAIAQLFEFAREDSLDPDIIASLNETLGAEAVFVAIAEPRSGKRAAAVGCSSDDALEIQLRKLGGVKSYRVTALSNSACLPTSLVATGPWRWQTGALAALLGLFVLAPVLRGWGSVVIDFKLPPHTKALFAVSLKRRPRKVSDRSARRKGQASWLFQKRLQSLNRYERRLDGKRIVFRWIPARRSKYYITVRGPLLDYTTEQIIGDFLEEKTVQVHRRKAVKVDFNMSPSEAAIEIRVTAGGVAVPQSQVCLRGVAGSQRYGSEGSAFLYAREGEHILVAADGVNLAELPIRIETLEPIRVSIELETEANLVFRDCPAAVDPYMAGDFGGAATALEAANQEQAAHRVRALWARAQGDRAAEARELAASGQTVASAEILAECTDSAAAAQLFEQAGEHKRAGEAYQLAGDIVAAARCYENGYDYENAIDCYRELGDSEKLIELLEASGDFLEAARAATQADQPDRAISNYQQVDSRHPEYSEACRDMGALLVARGHTDMAIEKFGEALELGGGDSLPLEMLTDYGQLLEDKGRGAEALDIYERVRRRDLNYGNISTRIESLKDDATRLVAGASPTLGPPGEPLATATAPEETRYEMLSELGRGGMGIVYKARDKHLGRLVAMKFLPDNLQQHPTAVKLFLREARATAALNHPNIVTMYDAAQQEGRYFISMECLEGVGLDGVLQKRGALPAKLLAQLGMQVCAGLDYAHRHRIVHRDIKPSNLFVTKERVLKIMDFGLAKAIEEVRRNSTVIGGTPNFMAPEQASGDRVDQRTDLYSLGATLFQLLTATVPFQQGDVAYHHRHTPPPDARERLATVPAEFAELLLQMMAKAPDDRVQSASEVGQRLKQIFEAS